MPAPKEYVARDGHTTWRVRFHYRGRSTSETFDTLKAARIFCRDYADRGVDYAVKMREQETERTPTVDELAGQFLAWKAPRVRSDRTVADYRRDYERWISPRFGSWESGRVSEGDVQAWVEWMLSEGASAKSIADRHALLHAIYKWANGSPVHLEHDPCGSTDLPKKRKGQPKGLRPAEWAALYSCLRQGSQDAADLAQFMLATGWRWSEATALTTYDVEDDGERVWVTVSQVIRRNAAGQHVPVEDWKADASARRVQLDSDAGAMVRRRVSWAKLGALVFTTPVSPQNGLGGGQWHYANFRDRHWVPAVEAANLARRPTPHWLRHTHVAWMVMAGASLPELQSRIGHASIKTTIDVYGRMVNDVSSQTLGTFAAMRGATPPPAIES